MDAALIDAASVDLRALVKAVVKALPVLSSRLARWLGLHDWSASERAAVLQALGASLSEASHTRVLACVLQPVTLAVAVVSLESSVVWELSALSLLVHAAPVTAAAVVARARRSDLLHPLEAAVQRDDLGAVCGTLQALLRLVSHTRHLVDWHALYDWRAVFALAVHAHRDVALWASELTAVLLAVTEPLRAAHRAAEHEVAFLQWSQEEARALRAASLLAVEAQGVQGVRASSSSEAHCLSARDLPASLASVSGLLVSARPLSHAALVSDADALVSTEASERALSAMALSVSAGRGVLVEGVRGSGKSALASALAVRMRVAASAVTRVHLTAQTDAKLLLGSYVVTEVPGEFRWVPGVLTRAVTEGHWLILEHVDAAPVEVQSLLLPLLERRELFVPGRGELLPAHDHFALLGTRALSEHTSHRRLLHEALWWRVHVDALSETDLRRILTVRWPALSALVDSLLAAHRASLPSAAHHSSAASSNASSTSARGVFKAAARCAALLQAHAVVLRGTTAHVSAALREAMWQECVDSWLSGVRDSSERAARALEVARAWGVSEERCAYFLGAHRPEPSRDSRVVRIGRATLALSDVHAPDASGTPIGGFAATRTHSQVLERVARAVECNESVLLVGETGVGKTTAVQQLAALLGQRLVVLNLNQQTDSADLLGGFKPVDIAHFMRPLAATFESLFTRTFSAAKNAALLLRLQQSVARADWRTLLAIAAKTVARVHALDAAARDGDDASAEVEAAEVVGEVKRARREQQVAPALRAQWSDLASQLARLERALSGTGGGQAFAFAFVEGALVEAVRLGHWVLLDEANLASEETLESLSALLEGGSLWLAERGDLAPLPRHPNFKLFACMNPPTDVGKRDLPPGVRSHFTELFVDEVDAPDDLAALVRAYVPQLNAAQQQALVTVHTKARKEALSSLSDGNGQRPRYSLRTFARALHVTRVAAAHWGVARAMHEGAALAYLTQLDAASHRLVEQLLAQHVPAPSDRDATLAALPLPGSSEALAAEHVRVEGVWLARGPEQPSTDARFILTATVARQLHALSRLVAVARYPVLLQGPTSAGKTSMVLHLAKLTGHRCVRINNHETTDLAEYLGQYVTDAATGALRFHEGPLVRAVREGHWLVLDELNLAPSDVLEALNRLLDDNRELVVPETGARLTPHPHFMLFATQNPSGLYGGRKPLSRAFRNRFVELHFDELSASEVEQILRERSLPPKLAAALVAVMRELQRMRTTSNVFAGKSGGITLRDLFRWADRVAARSHQAAPLEVAVEGYLLLAERLRHPAEREAVRGVLERQFKVALDMDAFYAREAQRLLAHAPASNAAVGSLVWTKAAQRVLVLVERCMRHGESALLVGDTGVGKTSVALAVAALRHMRAHVLNCHQHTESGDLLGALRPARGKERVREALSSTVALLVQRVQRLDAALLDEALLRHAELDTATLLAHARRLLAAVRALPRSEAQTAALALDRVLERQARELEALFAWSDGPLVTAMKRGDALVLDEISLAEDAVLERLNSVLEPARTLTLAEKGGAQVEELTAHVDFRLVATMNPGGDYGKKELSPALRNRFTEMWVPSITARDDLERVLAPTLRASLHEPWLGRVLDFAAWYNGDDTPPALTLRDLLAWTRFLDSQADALGASAAFVHGAALSVLDALGMAHTQHSRADCEARLLQLVAEDAPQTQRALEDTALTLTDTGARIGAFALPVRAGEGVHVDTSSYAWNAPTTQRNLLRLVRALQVPRKALLLEGSPGVGKTSLVTALAALCGQTVTRINLSEQSDMMDLLGADLPVERAGADAHDSALEFQWRDGPFLAALQRGEWVLLDEINLASQSVLEGLNAALDHRGTVYVPELGRAFVCPPTFRIFATQNPVTQGGGRKGLPRSFLNRFTKVHVDAFSAADLTQIASSLHPRLPRAAVESMVSFVSALHEASMRLHALGADGAPWEFNLRDVLRWCDLSAAAHPGIPDAVHVHSSTLFGARFRHVLDRRAVQALYAQHMARSKYHEESTRLLEARAPLRLTPSAVHVGLSAVSRASLSASAGVSATSRPLQRHSAAFAAALRAVQLGWPTLIVGASGSGKSALVRALASTCGQRLLTMHLSAAMDAQELLGSFEQTDAQRHRRRLLDELADRVHLLSARLFAMRGEHVDAMRVLVNLTSAWHSAQSRAQQSEGGVGVDVELLPLLERTLAALLDAHETLRRAPLATALNDSALGSEDDVRALRVRVNELARVASASRSGQFEWVDGPLVTAVREGHWLLLDNANLCAAAVLDRLNPLLEAKGVLVLSERGLVDGALVTLTPHPNFRIFLTVDPAHGEVSRAMRNRALEIALIDEEEDADEEGERMSHSDAQTLLRPLAAYADLRQRIVHLHRAVSEAATLQSVHVSVHVSALRALTDLGAVVAHQLERGVSVRVALQRAAELVYQHASPALIASALDTTLADLDAQAVARLGVPDAHVGALVDPLERSELSSALTEAEVLRALPSSSAGALVKHSALRASPSSLPLRVAVLRALTAETHAPLSAALAEALDRFLDHACVRALTSLSNGATVRAHLPLRFDPLAVALDLRSDDAVSAELRLRVHVDDWTQMALLSDCAHALWPVILVRVSERALLADSDTSSALGRALLFARGSLAAAALGSALLVHVGSLLRVLDTGLDALSVVSPRSAALVSLIEALCTARVSFSRILSATAFDAVAFALSVRWLAKLSQRAYPHLDAETRAALAHVHAQVNASVTQEVGAPSRMLLWKRGGYVRASTPLPAASALASLSLAALSPSQRRVAVEALATLQSLAVAGSPADSALLESLSAVGARLASESASSSPAAEERLPQALARLVSLRWQLELVHAVALDASERSALAARVEAFVAFSSSVACRSPSELAPFQRLQWLLTSTASTGLSSMLVALWCDSLGSLWSADDTVMSALSASLPMRLQDTAFVRLHRGPLALGLAAHTAMATRLFALEEPQVSIADREAHLRRVQALVAYLTHQSAAHTHVEDSAQSTWSQAYLTLGQALHALGSALPAEAQSSVQALLGALRAHILAPSAPSALSASVFAHVQSALSTLIDDERVRSLYSELVAPVLSVLHEHLSAPRSSSSSSSSSSLTASRALARIALLRVALLAPTQPVHPRAMAALKLSALQHALTALRHEHTALLALERTTSDRSESLMLNALTVRVNALEAAVSALQLKVGGADSDSAAFTQLFGALQQLTSTLVSPARVLPMLSAADALTVSNAAARVPHVLDHEAQWQRSLHAALMRLLEQHHEPALADIALPLVAAARELALAVRVHTHAAVDALHASTTRRAHGLLQSLLTWPSAQGALEHAASALGSEEAATLIDSRAALAQQTKPHTTARNLQSEVLRARLARVHVDALADSSLKPILETFAALCARDEAEEAARRAAEAETVRVRSTQKTIETDEQRDERRFRELFPDYEGEYADLLEDRDDASDDADAMDIERADKQGEEAQDAASSAVALADLERVRDAEMAQVVRAHEAAALVSANLSALQAHRRASLARSELTRAFSASYAAAVELQRALLLLAPAALDAHARAATAFAGALAVRRLSEADDAAPEDGANAALRFYRRASVLESGLLLAPLRALLARITSLLELFPQNALLTAVQKIAERVLGLPLGSALGKAVAGVELVLQRAQLWNETAPMVHALHTELAPLLALVSRWRRQELDEWPRLLAHKDEEHRTRAHRAWPTLYARIRAVETAVASAPVEEAEAALLVLQGELVRFCESSPWGEYAPRLALLRAFALLTAQSRVRALVDNVARYYAQWSDGLAQRIAEERAPLEKAMKDKVTLGRWEDRDTYRMKETASKSHRQLAKLARDYDVLLLRPMANYFEALATSERLAMPPDAAATKHDSKAKASELREAVVRVPASAEGAASASLVRVESASERVVRRHVAQAAAAALWPCAEGVAALSASLVSTVAEMRGITSRRHRPRKQRALVATLKQLQAMGLTWHRERLGPDELRDLPHLLAHAPLPALLAHADDAATLASADRYYYRSVAAVQRARVLATTAHADLPRLETMQARGLLEHTLSIAVEQRATLTSALTQLADLRHAADLVADYAAPADDAPLEESVSVDVSDVAVRVSALKECASLLAQTSAACESLRVSAGKILRDAADAVLTQLERLESAAVRSVLERPWRPLDALRVPLIASPSLSSALQASLLALAPVRATVLGALDTSEALVSAHVKRALLDAMDTATRPLASAAVASESTRAAVSECVETFVVEYQLAMQRIKAVFDEAKRIAQEKQRKEQQEREEEKKDAKEEDKEDKDKDGSDSESEAPDSTLHLLEAHKLHVHALEALAQPRLHAALQRVAKALAQAPGVRVPASVRALSEQTVRVGALLVRAALRYHRELVKLLFVGARVLGALFAEGFCGARETDEEEEASGSDKEGELELNEEQAGLGEGSGKKDVSEQLQDEEQALGEKPLKEEEQDEQQEMESAEGVEMEQDFDGEMRDLDREELEPDEKDEDEDEEEDEGKELDKEMGETNAQDEEIVDEKLWDEEDEDETGEKPKELEETQEQRKKSGEQREQELAANEDEHKEKDLEEQGAPEKQPQKKEGEGEEGDEDKEEKEGEGDEEDENLEPEQDDAAKESHAVPPRAPDEEYELPEELNLDGDEDGNGDDEQDGDEEQEGEDDAMDVDEGEQQDMPEDQDEKAQEDAAQGEGEEDEDEEQEEGKGDEQPQERLAEEQEDDAMDEEKPEQPEEEEGKEEEQGNAFPQVPREREDTAEAYGVEEQQGDEAQAQSVTQRDNSAHLEQKEREAQRRAEQDAAQQQPQQHSADGERRQGTQSAAEPAEQRRAPNPERSLGDALQHWQRELKVLEQSQQDSAQKRDEPTLKDKDAPKDDAKDEQAQYEYMDEKDEGEHDAQVMGVATDEQQQPIASEQEEDKMKEEEEENEKEEQAGEEEEEDGMDVDEDERTGKGGDAAQMATTQRPKRPEQRQEDERSEEDAAEEQQRGNAQDQDEPEEGSDPQRANPRVADGQLPQAEAAERQVELDADAVNALRAELSARVSSMQGSVDLAQGMAVWRGLQRLTAALSQELAEQLRLLLEPTLAAKLKGDYRSGKRLNMRKVIPYIASQFRKDKIWLRRTQPSKREYQVLVGVDDSESVALGGVGELLREALATLVQALVHVEVGQLGVARFGQDVELLHALEEPFSDVKAATLFPQLAFTQQRTDLVRFLERAVPLLEAARRDSRAQDAELRQLLFVVGDGRFGSERPKLKRWLRRAHDAHITVVYLAIDAPHAEPAPAEPQAKPKKRESLLDIQSVAWHDGKMALQSYMDEFPFDLYLIVREAAHLPRVLADALRQWFELSSHDNH